MENLVKVFCDILCSYKKLSIEIRKGMEPVVQWNVHIY